MKWLFALLLAINLVFFAVIQWGEKLTGGSNDSPGQPALNEEKIKLLAMSQDVPQAQSAMPAPTPTLADAGAASPAPAATPPVAEAQAVTDAACLEWGEFSSEDLKRANAALAQLKLGEQLSRRQVEHGSGYWVYIPPPKKQADIERKISVLKARGVADYFVVQEPGKWRNAISLGVFKTKEAATKLVSKLAAKGITTPVVGERMSKLKFTVFVLKNPDATLIEKMTKLHGEFEGSELRSATCPK